MLSALMAVIGLAGGILPEVMKWWNAKQANQQELAMFDRQIEMAKLQHTYKMQEIEATADIEEMKVLHTPQSSFGVQLLDAAHDKGLKGWAVVPAFYLFALLDALNISVRPMIAYVAFGWYMFYKWSTIQMMAAVSDKSFTFSEGIVSTWGENDWAILFLVLSFFFGQRSARWSLNKFSK